MVRFLYLALAVSVAIGISAASAQTNGRASSKLQVVTGAVKAISASSLTLERGGREVLVISVDPSTRLVSKGLWSDLVYRPDRRLTDLLKAGDRVTVAYRQDGSAMKAVEVRVVRK